jgi:hypothetical protein
MSNEAVAFYSKLFGTQPAKRRPGYANYANYANFAIAELSRRSRMPVASRSA